MQQRGGGPAARPTAGAYGPESPGAGDRTGTATKVHPEAAVLAGPVPEIMAGPELPRR